MPDPVQVIPPIDIRINVTVMPEWAEFGTELIKGQTPDQKAKLWQDWITFWGPWNKLSTQISTNVADQIAKLLKG